MFYCYRAEEADGHSMVDRRFLFVFGALLLAASALGYLLHLWLFEDLHHILVFLVGDIAFVPIEVLLVTLVVHRLLEARAMAERREKLGMLIGAFFSTVGIDLLAVLTRADPELKGVQSIFRRGGTWSPSDLGELRRLLALHTFHVDSRAVDLSVLREFMNDRQDFLLRLLENPALLEHESFSELMRAIFHLAEELGRRPDPETVPPSDRNHLGVDMDRVYPLLVNEWLDYLQYVGKHYPYLFSLALRTSPFDPDASVVVQEQG